MPFVVNNDSYVEVTYTREKESRQQRIDSFLNSIIIENKLAALKYSSSHISNSAFMTDLQRTEVNIHFEDYDLTDYQNDPMLCAFKTEYEKIGHKAFMSKYANKYRENAMDKMRNSDGSIRVISGDGFTYYNSVDDIKIKFDIDHTHPKKDVFEYIPQIMAAKGMDAAEAIDYYLNHPDNLAAMCESLNRSIGEFDGSKVGLPGYERGSNVATDASRKACEIEANEAAERMGLNAKQKIVDIRKTSVFKEIMDSLARQAIQYILEDFFTELADGIMDYLGKLIIKGENDLVTLVHSLRNAFSLERIVAKYKAKLAKFTNMFKDLNLKMIIEMIIKAITGIGVAALSSISERIRTVLRSIDVFTNAIKTCKSASEFFFSESYGRRHNLKKEIAEGITACLASLLKVVASMKLPVIALMFIIPIANIITMIIVFVSRMFIDSNDKYDVRRLEFARSRF